MQQALNEARGKFKGDNKTIKDNRREATITMDVGWTTEIMVRLKENNLPAHWRTNSDDINYDENINNLQEYAKAAGRKWQTQFQTTKAISWNINGWTLTRLQDEDLQKERLAAVIVLQFVEKYKKTKKTINYRQILYHKLQATNFPRHKDGGGGLCCMINEKLEDAVTTPTTNIPGTIGNTVRANV